MATYSAVGSRPTAATTYRVLYEGLDPTAAAAELMGREPTSE